MKIGNIRGWMTLKVASRMERMNVRAQYMLMHSILFQGKLTKKYHSLHIGCIQPVNSVIETLVSVREVWGSIPGSFKLNPVSPTARHHCDVS